VLFEKGTGISLSALPATPYVQLAWLTPGVSAGVGSGGIPAFDKGLVSDTAPALFAASPTRKVTLIGAPSGGDGFSVGGTYVLEPENGTLTKPATLTLKYSAEAAAGRDLDAFSIYHYDAQRRVWTPVACTHDRPARTLTATITGTGGYCIGGDEGAPEFALLLPSGAPAVVTTTDPQLIVGCDEDGSGLDPATFRALLDGRPLEGEWSSAAGCAVLAVPDSLAAGTHDLLVEGSDGAGNQGSERFEIEVRLPPGQAVLRLSRATSEQVGLRVEAVRSSAGQGGDTVSAYEIWRTDPGPGVSYRRLATVKPDSGAYTDTDVLAGETYRYVAVALSEEGVEGPPSEPLVVAVPPASGTETTAVAGVSTTIAGPGITPKTTTSTTAGAEAGAESESGRGGLGAGAWAGIIVACVVGVGLVAGVVLALQRKRRR
jgi:hypothetical protein